MTSTCVAAAGAARARCRAPAPGGRSSASSSSSSSSSSSRRVAVVAPARAMHAHGESSGGGAPAKDAPAGGHGHGHGGASSRPRPGEKKGFVEEMRFVAMKLHTREQAPKEGEAKPPPESKPMMQWEPTREKYLAYLVESKAMYEAMEEIVASKASPIYEAFLDTGLERTSPLAKDIEWFEKTYGLTAPVADGPGVEYGNFLKELAKTSPPEFICHFYNVYFAHSAGGRMIGRKVSEMILNGKELEFYKWEESRGGLEQSLADVKSKLNDAAEGWSREEKDRCLEETSKSFQMSGQLLRLIA